VQAAFQHVLGRSPDARERAGIAAFLQRQSEIHKSASHADAAGHAATDLCQVLLSLNEFAYVE
jgi:hypothetical protein